MGFWDVWILLSILSALLGAWSLLDERQVSSARSVFHRYLVAANGCSKKFLAVVTDVTNSFHEKGAYGRKAVLLAWAAAVVWASEKFGWQLREAFWHTVGSGVLSVLANFAFALFPFAVGLVVWMVAILASLAFSVALALVAIAAYPIVSNPYRLLRFRALCFAMLIVGQVLQLSAFGSSTLW